jgi:hypothetical protein
LPACSFLRKIKAWSDVLQSASADLMSITRAREVQVVNELDPTLTPIAIEDERLRIALYIKSHVNCAKKLCVLSVS